MDVKCNNCGAEYSLDETLVSSKGSSVRCMKCSVVFKVFPPNRSNFVAAKSKKREQPEASDQGVEKNSELKAFFAAAESEKRDQPGGSSREAGKEHGPGEQFASTILQQKTPKDRGASGETPAVSPRPVPMAKTVEPAKKKAGLSTPAKSTALSGNLETPPSPAGGNVSARKTEVTAKHSGVVFAKPSSNAKSSQDEGQAGTARASSSPFASRKTPVSTVPSSGKESGNPPGGDTLLEPPDPERAVAFSLQTLADAPDNVAPKGAQSRGAKNPSLKAPVSPSLEKPSAKPVKEAKDQTGPDFSQIPASDDDKGWMEGSGIQDVAGPAWADGSNVISARYGDDDDALPPPRRHFGPLIAVGVIIGLLGTGIYVFQYKKKSVEALFSNLLNSKDSERYKKFYDRGRENFLLDSVEYFRQADREYQKVLALEEDHPLTLAALGEMYAVWAQYLRDAKIEAIGDAHGDNENSEVLSREIERLNNQYEQKLAEATRWTEQARATEEVPAEAYRASADIKRLQGDLAGAEKDLRTARAMGADPETEYVGAMLDLEKGKTAPEVEGALARIIQEKPLIRAMYRRARLLASAGSIPEAREVLGKIFQLNSDHTRSLELSERLDNGKPVPLNNVVPVEETQEPEIAETTGNKTDSETEDSTVSTGDDGAAENKDNTPKDEGKPQKKTGADLRQNKHERGGEGGRSGSMLARASRMEKTGKTGDALKLYETILAREPSNLEALTGLGNAYLKQGAFGRAIANFRRALRVKASFGPALMGLAETFRALTQHEQALKYYDRYIKANPAGPEIDKAKRVAAQLRSRINTGESPANQGGGGAKEKEGNAEDNSANDTPVVDKSADGEKGAEGDDVEDPQE